MRKMIWLIGPLCLFSILASAADKKPSPAPKGSPYLFVWGGDEARQASDFLSVIDANPSSPTYGRIVATAPAGVAGTMPHHTEYEFPADRHLFANGWEAGHTFVFDLSHPLKPRLAANFTSRGGYSYPHSFVRLPNGDVLATFQSHGDAYGPGGGLVEMTPTGTVARSGSGIDPSVSKDEIWPYSLEVDSKLGRAVSVNSPMGMPAWAKLPPGSWAKKRVDEQPTSTVQVWRLSDLSVVKTVKLPADSAKHELWPAEPRLLPDGTMYVATFSCGLYRMNGLDTANPTAESVYSFPGDANKIEDMCFVPVVVGHYWVQTVSALPGLIVLDISNPAKPVEVSRLKIDGERYPIIHWIAADRNGDRLVISGAHDHWLLVAHIDRNTGKVTLDESFRTPGSAYPGIQFEGNVLPAGVGHMVMVHGALFGK
ncbi:MAG: hypothetical protein ACRD3E_02160 [Terriglobales bacterium]